MVNGGKGPASLTAARVVGICASGAFVFLGGCNRTPETEPPPPRAEFQPGAAATEDARVALDAARGATVIEIRWQTERLRIRSRARALDAAVIEKAGLEELERVLRDTLGSEGELGRLNGTHGGRPKVVSHELLTLIGEAQRLIKIDRTALPGAVDASAGPGWEQGLLAAQIDVSKSTVQLPEGARLEFGPLGSAYAISRVARVLAQIGVSDFLVENDRGALINGGMQNDEAPPSAPAGGPDTSDAATPTWATAVPRPGPGAPPLVVLSLAEGAVWTEPADSPQPGSQRGAGDAPRSVTVSVVAASTTHAAGLAAAARSMGPEPGLQFVGAHGAEAIICDDRGRVWSTPGLSKGLPGAWR